MTMIATRPMSPEGTDQPVLAVNGLRVVRKGRGLNHTIVSSLALAVRAGETVGIVGESGSGKSITARAITGLLPPNIEAFGDVIYANRNLLRSNERQWRKIRGREIGVILQDPFTMLNPLLRCGRIIQESLLPERQRALGRKERRAEALRRLAEVGIHDHSVVDRYPFQLSGGMRQRVAIAAALARDPQVLIADEPSTALDVTTQREILSLLRTVQRGRGMALILITHDLRVAFSMCDRIYVLYAGSMIETGASLPLEREPLHPYTYGLLLSEPPADRRVRTLTAIPGSVPAADEAPDSCVFAPRCRWARSVCRSARPPLREIAPNRLSACVRIRDIRGDLVELRRNAQAQGSVTANRQETAPLLEVCNLEKTFRAGKREVRALCGASIEVRHSESVGIVGESGSGKTTLARILVGLERASRGEITIGGVEVNDWSRLSTKERRRLRGVVQIVFQDPYSSLNPMRTVGATLREAITTHHPEATRVSRHVDELLDTVGLPQAYATRKPVALSGGERQRVAIARALATNPRILICDEPVSALDVSVQAQILNLFAALRRDRGLAYLFITHDLSIARQVTDYLYVMHHGRVVESGPTEAILTSPDDPYTIELLASVPKTSADWLARSE